MQFAMQSIYPDAILCIPLKIQKTNPPINIQNDKSQIRIMFVLKYLVARV